MAMEPKKGGRPVFTNIDRSKCRRVVPMKVLVLGLSKTGTSSMKQALLDLGYADVYHMTNILAQNPRDVEMWTRAFDACYGGKGTFGKEQWDQLLGHCEAVTDTPCVEFAHELIEAYPEAKVVLTTRDIDSWYESYMDTVGGAFVSYHRRYFQPWSIQGYLMPRWAVIDLFRLYFKYLGQEWYRVRAKKIYLDHVARIRLLVPKDNLLEFDVKEGWEPLCKFLGVPVPKDKPFPRIMDRAQFYETHKNVRTYEKILMTMQTAKILGGLVVVGLISWYVGKRYSSQV